MVLRASLALVFVCVSAASAYTDDINVSSDDWAWWRGPNHDGAANPNQNPPTTWDDETNVLWKVPVPGRGHASPTVVGDHVYLATADEERQIQSVLCFNRTNGERVWKTDVHHGGFESEGRPGHVRASKASSTIASDGHRLFVNFINSNAVYTTALNMDGEQLWQQKVTDYVLHQGYGSSPTVYGPLVIVSADNKGGGAIAAFNRESGELAWKNQRPELPNYTSPIILKVNGREQVVFSGCDLVSSFDPMTGEKLWETPGATTECVTSVVTDGAYVFTSGGYPANHIAAVNANGPAKEVWRNDVRVYVPSLLEKDEYIYGVTDAGEAFCYEGKTGKQIWQERVRAKFTASPVLVGDNVYALSDRGETFVFKAKPDGFELVSKNDINADDVFASPVVCGGRVYLRVARTEGGVRQEMLYCIGK